MGFRHKRGRPKSGRAGCLLCKPHKDQRAPKRPRPGGDARRDEGSRRDLERARVPDLPEEAFEYAAETLPEEPA